MSGVEHRPERTTDGSYRQEDSPEVASWRRVPESKEKASTRRAEKKARVQLELLTSVRCCRDLQSILHAGSRDEKEIGRRKTSSKTTESVL